eukprot:CAMPEP_0173063048 /NCGR_PEP_ID=MMETSP1102-20130122/4154_1 /TAXON_ID=49646 /ORGANISM="Geminigera sp., Strain Caron Lab Isolate" /LENGTH=88 /DNA_ID=CAMNT_0013929781 /DNA_START=267 /DNA_END=533 /DNA_ORIENTATION=-
MACLSLPLFRPRAPRFLRLQLCRKVHVAVMHRIKLGLVRRAFRVEAAALLQLCRQITLELAGRLAEVRKLRVQRTARCRCISQNSIVY